MAAAESGSVTRFAVWALGAFVIALLGSMAWGVLRPPERMKTAGAEQRVIRVQVLNGTGESGIAARVASWLREGGFQVVEVRNADRSDYFATLVVSRRPELEAAQAVARYLGGPPVIRQAWTSDLAEVTVVLGSDRSRLRLE